MNGCGKTSVDYIVSKTHNELQKRQARISTIMIGHGIIIIIRTRPREIVCLPMNCISECVG